MLHVDACEFVEREMKPRWPDWQPTAAQAADWAEYLRPYAVDEALAAVRQVIAETRYNKAPVVREVMAACRGRQRPTVASRRDPAGLGVVTTYLVIDEPGCPPVPGGSGRIVEMVALDAGGAIIDAAACERRAAAAHAYGRAFLGGAGATWEVVCGDKGEALERAAAIRTRRTHTAALFAPTAAAEAETPW